MNTPTQLTISAIHRLLDIMHDETRDEFYKSMRPTLWMIETYTSGSDSGNIRFKHLINAKDINDVVMKLSINNEFINWFKSTVGIYGSIYDEESEGDDLCGICDRKTFHNHNEQLTIEQLHGYIERVIRRKEMIITPTDYI